MKGQARTSTCFSEIVPNAQVLLSFSSLLEEFGPSSISAGVVSGYQRVVTLNSWGNPGLCLLLIQTRDGHLPWFGALQRIGFAVLHMCPGFCTLPPPMGALSEAVPWASLPVPLSGHPQ